MSDVIDKIEYRDDSDALKIVTFMIQMKKVKATVKSN